MYTYMYFGGTPEVSRHFQLAAISGGVMCVMKVPIFTIFGLLFLTSTSSGRHSRGRFREIIPIRDMNKQKIVMAEGCTTEACLQNCKDAYRKYYDVTGNCKNFECECEYPKPCTIRACYKMCKTRHSGMLGLTGTCERTNCVCDWSNTCDKKTCKQKCVGLHGPGTKAKCVREDCVCRKDNLR